MKKSFRAFLAIDFSKKTKKNILKNIEDYRSTLSSEKIKWTKEEKLHITLCFLGNITEEQHIKINKALSEKIKNIPPLSLKLKNLIPFPSKKKFHILAIDVEKSEPLKELAKTLKEEVSACGLETEKRGFKPHVTVARIEKGCEINQQFFGKDGYSEKNDPLIELPPISFKVSEVKLLKSELGPEGSIYTPIASYKLKENSI